jgi:hypothetical protein
MDLLRQIEIRFFKHPYEDPALAGFFVKRNTGKVGKCVFAQSELNFKFGMIYLVFMSKLAHVLPEVLI